MQKVITDFLKKNQIDLSDSYVCIGISTGVDSTVLSYLLESLQEKLNFKLVLCHVNHKKRLQSEQEEAYITSYAKSHNLILEVLHLDLKEIENENFQSAARMKRLAFFNEVMNKYNAKYLFLAHHLNDDMETSLMHLIRGSNLKGYSGISEVTYNHDGKVILRPLLTILKEDILKYAKDNNIKYYEDASNSELDYTRNRIRHKVIPTFFEENPSFDKEFLEYKETLYNAYLIVCEKRDKFINEYIKFEDNLIKFNKDDFDSLNEYMKIEVLFELLKAKNLSRKNILEIINLISTNKANLECTYKDILFKKVYNEIIINNEVIQLANESVDILIDEVRNYDINSKYYLEIKEFNKEDIEKNKISLNNLNLIWYNSNNLPIRLRNRRIGDKISIKGGSKKVKDLLIDEKIPLYLRDNLLLLEKDDDVINIFGVKKSFNLLSTKDNNILITLKERDNEVT